MAVSVILSGSSLKNIPIPKKQTQKNLIKEEKAACHMSARDLTGNTLHQKAVVCLQFAFPSPQE